MPFKFAIVPTFPGITGGESLLGTVLCQETPEDPSSI